MSILSLSHNKSMMVDLLEEKMNQPKSSCWDDDWSEEDDIKALQAVLNNTATDEQKMSVEGMLMAQDF